jgi:arylsulfatase
MKKEQNPNDLLQRSVLPIPDRRPISLTTYTAKDPDTKFPTVRSSSSSAAATARLRPQGV